MRRKERNYWRTERGAASLRGMLGAAGFKSRKCRSAAELVSLARCVFRLGDVKTCDDAATAVKAISAERRRLLVIEQRSEISPARKPKSAPKPKQEWAPSQAKIDAFYASWEWKRARYDFLLGQKRVCGCCGATGKIVVDHIKPIRRYWPMRLDGTNLQVLCDDCNMGKGSRDETDWRGA